MVGVTLTIRKLVVAMATEAEEVVALVKDAKVVAVATWQGDCWYCGKPNHKASECRKQKFDLAQKAKQQDMTATIAEGGKGTNEKLSLQMPKASEETSIETMQTRIH